MIPSANSSTHHNGGPTWHSAEAWPDHAVPSVCSALESRYFHPPRQQDWEWDNAMILAQHSASGYVGDQEGDYKPSIMQAEPIGGISNLCQYDGLLSATMNPSNLNLSNNTWSLLNTIGVRTSGGLYEGASPSFQASTTPYYGSIGTAGVNAYTGGNGSSLYGDPRSNLLGLVNLDHRRLQDIVKRELYTTADFNARIGLNLGGRTYFSADDYAFGRFGKRPRPNSPGAQAPLCQAEGCKADLSVAKHYHRRHKVCEYHSKAATVLIAGQTQRFCQQCSRFHVLSEFDDGKRSCRKRLADHNRRRRKPQPSPAAAVSSTAEQSGTQKKNDSDETTESESLRNGKGSPTTEEPVELVSATTPPSLPSQEAKRQVSEHPESIDQKEENHNFMQENRSGPSLSLTTLGGGSHATTQRQPTEDAYAGVDLPVPWLRPGSSKNNLMENVVTRMDDSPNGHMQRTDPPDLRSSVQKLFPLQTSRDRIGSTDWIIKSMEQHRSEQVEDFLSPNLRLNGKSEGHEVLRLLERRNERDGEGTNRHGQQTLHATLGFLEQPIPSTGTSDSDLITETGIKFPTLQDLSP